MQSFPKYYSKKLNLLCESFSKGREHSKVVQNLFSQLNTSGKLVNTFQEQDWMRKRKERCLGHL